MSGLAPRGYRLIEHLGAGSVFDVALVAEVSGGPPLVCKRLAPRPGARAAALRAFARERAVLEALVHPALPALRASGEDERGPYLVEAVMRGISLAALCDAFGAAGAPAPAERAAQPRAAGILPGRLLAALLGASFGALAELHALADARGPLGFVHGNLAPDHLLVTPDAEVGFVDLGQARYRDLAPALLSGDADSERGTLPYVAPELARGAAAPSQASDVYALASSLAYAVLGRAPLASSEPAAMLAALAERGLDVALVCDALAAQLSPASATAFAAALAFEPDARASARATARALARA